MSLNNNTEKIRTTIKFTGTTNVSANVEQNVFVTTEDKVRILYYEYNAARKKVGETMSWLGIFVSLLITILTCEYKPVLFLEPSVVKAFFLFVTIASGGMLIKGVVSWIITRKKLTFDFFITKIRGEQPVKTQNGPSDEEKAILQEVPSCPPSTPRSG